MKILHAIDWTSIKLGGVSLLGFALGSQLLAFLAGAATMSTIVYNAIKIIKELKKKP